MTSWLVIFRALFFLKYLKKNIKTSKLDRTITLNSVTLKNAQTEPQKYIIFFNETNNI